MASRLPSPGLLIPDEEIEADLKQLTQVTSCIRTYSAARAQGKITRIADKLGLRVLQGIWIGRNRRRTGGRSRRPCCSPGAPRHDRGFHRRQRDAAPRRARRRPHQGLSRGGEAALRPASHLCRCLGVLAAIASARFRRRFRHHPHPALLGGRAGLGVGSRRACARDTGESTGEFSGKEILIGEVGWPSEGRMRAGALPSPANQAMVLSGVVEAARAGKLEGQSHRGVRPAVETPTGRHSRRLLGLVRRHHAPAEVPLWRADIEPSQMAHRGRARHWRGLSDLRQRLVFTTPRPWRGSWGNDLAVAAIALSAGLVFGWAAIGLPMEPPEPGDRLRSAGMIALSLLVPMAAACSGGARDDRLRLSPLLSTGRSAVVWTYGARCLPCSSRRQWWQRSR